jgi:transcription factor TGA
VLLSSLKLVVIYEGKGPTSTTASISQLPFYYSALSGIAAFEIEHTHWVEEQIKRTTELRAALQARVSDIELRMLVEGMISHYDNLFQIKAIIAKSDVFYLMSGKWKTQAERFFLWIGGARPSEIMKVF